MYIANEMEKSTADKSLQFDFQGKKIYQCRNSIYWYRWGKWVFDIREIRKVLGMQPTSCSDTAWFTEGNGCYEQKKKSFDLRLKALTDEIGSTPFEAVMKSAAAAEELQRRIDEAEDKMRDETLRKQMENRSVTIDELDDDLPF